MSYNIFLTIGSFVLLGTLLLSTNNLVSYNSLDSLENEYLLAAYGAAQSVIEEARLKAFDENTKATPATDTASFTEAGSLGPDLYTEAVLPFDELSTAYPASEEYPRYRSTSAFDDVDDYNGYVRVLPQTRAYEGDTIRVTVAYADPEAPGEPAAGRRTMLKLMTVRVTNRYFSQPVELTFGFTY
jgi:hypothetical protein